MYVDGAIEALQLAAERLARERGLVHHLAGVLCEREQQRELGTGEAQQLTVAERPALGGMQRQHADFHRRLTRGRAGAASQQCLDTRQQLARQRRLGEVVVGTELEADDAVERLAAGREHQHRQCMVAAQLL